MPCPGSFLVLRGSWPSGRSRFFCTRFRTEPDEPIALAASLWDLDRTFPTGGFGGKAVTLAEGALYAGDPDNYKKQLNAVC